MEHNLRCGCSLWVDNKTLTPDMTFCPLHKAAPDLYEALKLALDEAPWRPTGEDIKRVMRQAIAKAES